MARYLVAFVALVAITALASSQQAEAGLLAYGLAMPPLVSRSAP